jgi:dTDP-4-dehydrorhamnose reductase
MHAIITGASGFVGSNIAKVFTDHHGDTVATERVDMTDGDAVASYVGAQKPDAIIHSAIMNDYVRMYEEREVAWDAFVGATRHYARAAAKASVPFVLVSTDWVFDGVGGPYNEFSAPNPLNFYGVLKVASEQVALENGGAVARVSGVNGHHWARPTNPREQDPGFGYFVASIVDALEQGQRFTVWEAENINMKASPSLAAMCGTVMRAIADQGKQGTFHCCGSDAVTRRELAELACDVFELDSSLLKFGPPPNEAHLKGGVPNDSSLSAVHTSNTLGTPLPDVRTLLEAFRHERQTGELARLG